MMFSQPTKLACFLLKEGKEERKMGKKRKIE